MVIFPRLRPVQRIIKHILLPRKVLLQTRKSVSIRLPRPERRVFQFGPLCPWVESVKAFPAQSDDAVEVEMGQVLLVLLRVVADFVVQRLALV